MRATLVAVLAVAVAAVAGLRAEDVKIDKLPKAVTAALKKRFPKAELLSATKETADKKTTYEVTLKDGGAKSDVDVAEDGTLLGFETTVALKDLPKAVVATVAAKYPKGKMKSAESVTKVTGGKEALECYEVMVTEGEKDTPVYVLPDGKIKPEEKK